MKGELNQNLSGNVFYYTACSLLVILQNSFSKLHCQKGFDFILIYMRSGGAGSLGFVNWEKLKSCTLQCRSRVQGLGLGAPLQFAHHCAQATTLDSCQL